MKIVIIQAGHFTAAVVLEHDALVTAAAPIVKYMRDWDLKDVLDYVASKGWEARVLSYEDQDGNSG